MGLKWLVLHSFLINHRVKALIRNVKLETYLKRMLRIEQLMSLLLENGNISFEDSGGFELQLTEKRADIFLVLISFYRGGGGRVQRLFIRKL